MKHNKQKKGKRKSLPKETCMKSICGEGHGAVAGNASAKNLSQSGSERLNHFALTHSNSAAKIQQKTETTKKKVQNLINNGYSITAQGSSPLVHMIWAYGNSELFRPLHPIFHFHAWHRLEVFHVIGHDCQAIV